MRTTRCETLNRDGLREASHLLTSALLRIIRIPFTGAVKLRALLLKAGPAGQTPAKVALVRLVVCANAHTLTKTAVPEP